MVRLQKALVAFGVLSLLAAAAMAGSPLVARAANPLVTPQQSQMYTNNNGVIGWPDPNGPPAPSATCNTSSSSAEQCDRQLFDFGAGTSSLSDVFSMTVTVSFMNMNTTPDGPNCLDVAIEDSTASTVYAHASCAPNGAAVTDPNVTPGTTYTVEVDGDAANGAAAPAQPFSYQVSGAATQGSGGPTPTPTPTDPFTFTHEVSVDVQHGDGEPDVAIDPANSNTMFTGTPWGFSTTVSLLWKSQDGGVQWNNLHGAALGDTPTCPNVVGDALRPDCSRGGGDAEVQFSQPGPSSTQSRVHFEDLNGLDSISCAYSDNGGNTFTDLESATPPAGNNCNEGTSSQETCTNSGLPGCATAGTDRQWLQDWPATAQPSSGTCGPSGIACGSSDELFMTFDTGDQPPSGDAAIYSPDNGKNWTIACTTTTGPSCVGGSNGVGSRPGPLVIDTRAAARQTVGGNTFPTLYEFMGTNGNGTEVNISCDGGKTWANIATSSGLAGSTTNDFVAGAIDQNGELYTAFSVANDPNPWRIWFNHSVPGSAGIPQGSNCSQPVQDVWGTPTALTGPPSNADKVGATPIPFQNYAVMPWLVAGAGGRVDLVYYTTTQAVPFSPDNAAATWYLHMAQTLDGGSTWTDEQATETPMHLQSICFSGIGCTAQTPPGGDRNLLDFFEVKVDPSGRAVIIFTDDANSAACAPTCTEGIGLISEVQQATGPSLLSTGDVPLLSSTGSPLQQSLDVLQAGSDAEITRNEPGNSVLANATDNIAGTILPAADITDLKVCLVNDSACPVKNTSANTVAFLFTLRDLVSGGTSAAVDAAAGGTAANWLVTWRSGTPNDLWFAQATQSATDANNTPACIAGRPSSVYNDGEPKAAEYVYPALANQGTRTESVTCWVNATGNVVNGQAPDTIEIDVPMDSISGLSNNTELYGLTGWTTEAVTELSMSSTACSTLLPGTSNCGGGLGFFSNIAETAPMDVAIGQPAGNTPETPLVPGLAAVGLLAIGAGVLLRRRRRDSLSAI